MKRYRDAAGRLTMTVDEIAAATLDEANAYYQDGGRYIYEAEPTPCAATSTRTHTGTSWKLPSSWALTAITCLQTRPAWEHFFPAWPARGRKSPAFDPPAGEWR